jgi:hypothetical protein
MGGLRSTITSVAYAKLSVGGVVKQGTLPITTGTPLDMTSNIDQAYIQGRELNMMDIQKWFFQKYMEKIKQQQPKPVP